MRRLLSIAAFSYLSIIFLGCNSEKETDPLQKKIGEKQLKEDFTVFRRILDAAHPSLNVYLNEAQSEKILDSLYGTLNGNLTLGEFYNKIFFFINEIKDAHSFVSLPDEVIDTLYNRKNFFPIPVILIGNRLFVNNDDIYPHGTELLFINNRSVSEILDSIILYNPVDGVQENTQKTLAALNFGFQYYTRFGGYKEFSVSLRDTSGNIQDHQTIAAVNLDELYSRENNRCYFDQTDVPYSLYINEKSDYAILRLATFEFSSKNQRDAFDNFMKNSFELLRKKPECKNLIIDIRENDGGYLYECFLVFSYLTNKPFKEYRAVYTKLKKLPYASYLSDKYDKEEIEEINENIKNEFIKRGPFKYAYTDSLNEEWLPAKNRYRGNVFVITNAGVMSSASYLAALVKNSGIGKIVGTETGGGGQSGNGFSNIEYKLPNSRIKIQFSYARLYYTNSTSSNNSGVLPDFYTPDTDSSFLRNEDRQIIFIKDSIIKK